MHARTVLDVYKNFSLLIRTDAQKERGLVQRRMLSVFMWCFLVPAVLAVLLLMGSKMGFLPRKAGSLSGWLILIFPVLYSVFFISSEVLRSAPQALMQGGTALTLKQFQKEAEWRNKFAEQILHEIAPSQSEWDKVLIHFKTDLNSMKSRTSYMTALAAAVFFLIMQGIDSISDIATKAADQALLDPPQFIGLGLFLLLLHISGSQAHVYMQRYLACAELVAEHLKIK